MRASQPTSGARWQVLNRSSQEKEQSLQQELEALTKERQSRLFGELRTRPRLLGPWPRRPVLKVKQVKAESGGNKTD